MGIRNQKVGNVLILMSFRNGLPRRPVGPPRNDRLFRQSRGGCPHPPVRWPPHPTIPTLIRPLRATFPIPFVPSGHFPLIRGIGPLGGGRLCPFPRNHSKPFGVPLIRPLRGHLPPGEGFFYAPQKRQRTRRSPGGSPVSLLFSFSGYQHSPSTWRASPIMYREPHTHTTSSGPAMDRAFSIPCSTVSQEWASAPSPRR